MNFSLELSVRHERTVLYLEVEDAGVVAKVGALPPCSCVFPLMAECKFIIIYCTVYIDHNLLLTLTLCNVVTMP